MSKEFKSCDSTQPAQETPRVAVIVLNWNNYSDSAKCLESVLHSEYPNLWPILVDNGSMDNSGARLRQEFPSVTHIRNEENVGFSRGCNVGLRFALADAGCDYFLLLNNDCLLHNSGIAAALHEFNKDTTVGAVTGKVLFKDGSRLIWHAGGRISRLMGRASCRGFREIDAGQYEDTIDTGWASGAMMILSRATLETTGLLPEEYFFGVEEWDYSLSLLDGGWKIRYVPHFIGYHDGDGSHHNHDPKFVYNYYRNKLLFQQKNLGNFAFHIWKAAFSIYLAIAFKRKMSRLIDASHFPFANETGGRVADLLFAAQEAVKDHGKNRLDEKVLIDFSRRHDAWKAGFRKA